MTNMMFRDLPELLALSAELVTPGWGPSSFVSPVAQDRHAKTQADSQLATPIRLRCIEPL
jgi:hypothetical protein